MIQLSGKSFLRLIVNNLFDTLYEPSDYEEDSIREPYFQLDPFEMWEVDIEYAQGEM